MEIRFAPSVLRSISISFVHLAVALLLCGNGAMPYDRLFGSRTLYQGREIRFSQHSVRVKRVGAVALDYLVLAFALPLSTFAVLLIKKSISGSPMMAALVFSVFAYSSVCDFFFKGVTLGKKAAGLKVEFLTPISPLKFALLHSLLKNLSALVIILSLVVYICCQGVMPYDRWLHMYVEEKNGVR